MILMSISMCKHFHRRYASKWFVWIGGTIYINIEKKMRVNLLPLSNSTFLKTSSSVLKESWYIFFHQFVSVICTHSMAVYMYETWTDSSIKIRQKNMHFPWFISNGIYKTQLQTVHLHAVDAWSDQQERKSRHSKKIMNEINAHKEEELN